MENQTGTHGDQTDAEVTVPQIIPEYRVLLIDDDPDYASLLRRQLLSCERARFVFEAVSRLEAATAAILRDEHDAYLIDFKLGSHSGLDLIRFAREHDCSGALILLTGMASPNADAEALQVGAADFLEKDRASSIVLDRTIRYAVHWKQTEGKLRSANRRLSDGQERLRQANEELTDSHRRLQEAQLQLIQAEKLEGLGRLSASLAHELKNPLAIVSMGLEYIRNHLPEGENVSRSVLNEMNEAVGRADTIIKGMLDFSAPMRLEQSEEHINDVVRKALLFVRTEMARNDVHIREELSGADPVVHIDRNKMIQVFINLLMNAQQAMADGGVITVRSRVGSVDVENADEGEARGPGAEVLTIDIEDTGPGIPEDKLRKVFDPFFTTKPTGLGTGLGLAVTHSIIELHGAAIDVMNREEGGLRVSIRFLL